MKLRYSAVLVLATTTLAACGSSSVPSTGSSATTEVAVSATGPSATEASNVAFNDADVAFAQNMIGHHQQAIEMATLALDPTSGAGAQVTDLAKRIQSAQDPEITMMTAWLDAWGQPMTMDSTAGHDMGMMSGTQGMMSEADMDQLKTLTGPEFDKAWLQGMVEHHQGAIAMAEQISTDGENPDVKALADQVITAQQTEVDEMNGLLAG